MNRFKRKLSRKLNPPDVLAKVWETFFEPLYRNRELRERRRWNSTENQKPYSPVFIIAPPRSGSTLLYQSLVNHLNVLYISNFTHIFAASPFTGFKLFFKYFDSSGPVSFESRRGNTLKTGWDGPSECARFWYRHLPKTSHYVDPREISEDAKEFYKQNILGLQNKYNQPFLFKNLNAAMRIEFLNEILPNSKFIIITREPVYNAQSILISRREQSLSENEWWSVKPRNYHDLLGGSDQSIAVGQVFHILEEIKNNLGKVPESRFYNLSYEDFCSRQEYHIKKIADFIGDNVTFKGNNIKKIGFRNERKVSKEDFEKLEDEMRKYNWEELKKIDNRDEY